ENVLSPAELLQAIHQAVADLRSADANASRRQLQSVADRLLAAREVVYPVTIHLLDVCLLDKERPAESLPASFEQGVALNLIASAALLERMGRDDPERLSALRERVQGETVEVCGGPYLERADALLPLESQLWNLTRGLAAYRHLLGQDVRTFARG